MAATAISGLTALTAPTVADQLIVVDDSAGDNKSLALSHLALLGTANVFTAAQTIPAIVTASGALTVTPAAGSGVNIVLSTTGDFVVNTNQFVVDTSAGRTGIGTTVPEARFEVNETTAAQNALIMVTARQENERNAQVTFRTLNSVGAFAGGVIGSNGALGAGLAFRGDTGDLTSPHMVLDSAGRVGINDNAPTGKLHIDQSSTTGAIPVLKLDQADISEGFVDYIGTSAASAAGPISTWTAATIAGYVRCEINGAAYWMPYYNAPTA